MLETIRQFFRDNPRMWWVAVGAVLTAALVAWFVFGGLVPEIGRFFAAGSCPIPESEWTCEDGDCDDDAYPNPGGPQSNGMPGCNDPDDADPCVTGSTPISECNPSATPTPDACVVPESEWTCGDGDCDDDGYPNPAGPAAFSDEACNDPDDANRCTRGSIPVAACGPAVTPTPTTPTPTPTPTGGSAFPDCLVIQDQSSSDPNFGTMTEWTIPRILADRPGAQLYYQAQVTNNCSYPTHLEILYDGSRTASFDQGVGRRNLSVGSNGFTESGPPDRMWAPGESAQVRFAYNFSTYTCGSLGLSITWKHLRSSPSTSDPRGVNFSTSLNYGNNCTGAAGERAPGGGGTTTIGPTLPPGSVPPVTLSVSCGTTQNVLTWTTIPAGSTGSSIIKNTDGADGVYLVQGLPMSARTYTDTNVQSGHRYSYTFKNSPTTRSNTVTCLNGTGVTPTPTASLPPPGDPITCAPLTQTIFAGQTARVDAGGGNGVFVWSGSGGGIQQDLGPSFVVYQWNVAGTKVVQAQSAGQSASCLVSVIDPTTTITTEPSATFQTYNPTGSPTSTNVTQIPTGPSDVIILALAAAASLTLLYAAYTRSPSFAQREIERASKEHDPLDFRT